jgi:hypothetical protein
MDFSKLSDQALRAYLAPVYEKRWIASPEGKWEKFPWWGDPLKEIPSCEQWSAFGDERKVVSQRMLSSARTWERPKDDWLVSGHDVRNILGYHETWRGRGLFYQRLLPAVYLQTNTTRLYFRLRDLIRTIEALQGNSWSGYRRRGNLAAQRFNSQIGHVDLLRPQGGPHIYLVTE